MFSIGIDSVDIERFKEWSHYSYHQLLKVFSDEELTYALSDKQKEAERLAVRFAAKEAFYKALSPLIPSTPPFLKICKLCSVTKSLKGTPLVQVAWEKLSFDNTYDITASLTHSRTQATAVVIIINKKLLSEKAL